LRAARAVINERGYEAATFQAIAQRAGFSRPTMHYYFHTKEQIYDSLQQEAYSVVSDCIAQARREKTLLRQLATFVSVARRMDEADGSMMRFLIASRWELHRNPSLRGGESPAAEAVGAFYEWMVAEAARRGELSPETDTGAVANMLFAMFWGIGFFAGFVHEAQDVAGIAKQLHRMFRTGLLSGTRDGVVADVVVGEFARPWQFEPLESAAPAVVHPDAV
jgi:AcrR family transcriptional regulator